MDLKEGGEKIDGWQIQVQDLQDEFIDLVEHRNGLFNDLQAAKRHVYLLETKGKVPLTDSDGHSRIRLQEKYCILQILFGCESIP